MSDNTKKKINIIKKDLDITDLEADYIPLSRFNKKEFMKKEKKTINIIKKDL